MKKLSYLFIAVIVVSASIFLLNRNSSETDSSNIRIGWQTAWATQGQLVQVLKNTDLLSNNQLEGEFKGASYGGPLNEAAAAGEVDVIFTADQPAAALISRTGDDWVIVSRLMYNRVGVYVPPFSPVDALNDLEGGNLVVPFGAAAQRYALSVLENAGLVPDETVNVLNLGVNEQAALVDTRSGDTWGTTANPIHALATFDPAAATLETSGKAKPLSVGTVVSVVVMRREFIQDDPDRTRRFLKAYTDAWYYYSQNQSEANEWFIEDSSLSFGSDVLDLAASVEPNLFVSSQGEQRFSFSDSDIEVMQSAADFLYERNVIRNAVNMSDHIITDYLPEEFSR